MQTQGLLGPEQVSSSDPVSFLWQGASGADGEGARQGEAGPGESRKEEPGVCARDGRLSLCPRAAHGEEDPVGPVVTPEPRGQLRSSWAAVPRPRAGGW